MTHEGGEAGESPAQHDLDDLMEHGGEGVTKDYTTDLQWLTFFDNVTSTGTVINLSTVVTQYTGVTVPVSVITHLYM